MLAGAALSVPGEAGVNAALGSVDRRRHVPIFNLLPAQYWQIGPHRPYDAAPFVSNFVDFDDVTAITLHFLTKNVLALERGSLDAMK